MKLTAKGFANPRELGMHSDDDTPDLYLCIGKTGGKSWLLRTMVPGKRTEIGLGSAQVVGLAEARELACEQRKLARQGGDPLAEKRGARTIPTFREAATTVHAALLPTQEACRDMACDGGRLCLPVHQLAADRHSSVAQIG